MNNFKRGYVVSDQASNQSLLVPESLGRMPRGAIVSSHGGGQSSHSNYSPVPGSTKRKPPLPAPFMAKIEGSHSNLKLYTGVSTQ